MSRIKQLGKDSAVYGIGGILAKSISFFTLPIYTRIFTPADYGTIEMLTVMSSFLAAILVMGMDAAQSMYFFKHKAEGKAAQARIVSAILQWRLLFGSVIVLTATLLAPLLNAAFFNGKLTWGFFAIAFVGTLFAQIMSQSAEVMRLLYRPWGYIGITFTQSLFGAGLVLIFVLVFDQGILGFFLGAAVSSAAVAVFGWFRIREYLAFERMHWDLWPQLLRFGAPLVPAGMAMYFMNTADRWFVQYYHGSEALGIFSVGAKFTMLATIAVTTFRQAWWPIAMDAMHSDDGPETFCMIARLYLGVACAGIVVLTCLSPWLVKWLTGPSFHDAWPIVGILAWQSIFFGFYLIVSRGIWKAEKTYLLIPIMSIAAVAGLILNWLLVPPYGGMGAAVATAIVYLIWIIASVVVSEHLWPIGVVGIAIIFQVVFGIVAVVSLILLLKSDHFIIAATLTSCTALILMASSVNKVNRQFVIAKFRNR